MEQLNLLMRKTFATATPNEVCFIHVPKERVDKRIFNARFGYDRDIEDDGVTYSFNKSKLQQLFTLKPPASPNTTTIRWTLSIPPCTERNIVTVVLDMAPAHSTQELVIATYVPHHAAETTGKMAVHFFEEDAAAEFKRANGLVE
jgi:hypothetical protein